MIVSSPTIHAETSTQGDLFGGFDSVADSICKHITEGILGRIQSFPARGEESAPIFVVYKLIHEAFSNAPQFFRSALVKFLRAQPDRFSAVFNRETIWSVMAARPLVAAPSDAPTVDQIACCLAQPQRRGIWWRSDADILLEAEAVHRTLQQSGGKFRDGFNALRALQSEKARGIACGNLLLPVPGRLAAYAQEVAGMGKMSSLPSLKEIHGRIDEFARDNEADARRESIPIDLLYTTLKEDQLHVRILVRAKATAAERTDIRRRALYLRYFFRKAFTGYQPDQLDVKLAFYLDDERTHLAWLGKDSLFHPEEWINRSQFWNELCPGADPTILFGRIRATATKELTSQKVVERLKAHFSRGQSTPK